MQYKSLPVKARDLKATKEILAAVYDAAYHGLRDDNLALAAGLLPVEYRRLCEMDPIVEITAKQGRADAELQVSRSLMDRALEGDYKASIEILRHTHGWVAKQAISVEVDQKISITAALEQANLRVIDGISSVIQTETLSSPDSERVES